MRFFAAAEEAAGTSDQALTATTLGEVRRALTAQHPSLAAILPRCAVLVDGRRIDDATALQHGALIDVLPPFAGG